jgi:hypothetical protein
VWKSELMPSQTQSYMPHALKKMVKTNLKLQKNLAVVQDLRNHWKDRSKDELESKDMLPDG